MIEKIRNIAIIAHVDHGKTTLNERLPKLEQQLDVMNLERARGITIHAKHICVHWREHQTNTVDTLGCAEIGTELSLQNP